MGGEGSGLAIEELVDRHLSVLYKIAFRWTGSVDLSQDLVQETFLIATRKLHQLREPDAALAWLTRIMRHSRLRLLVPLPRVDFPLEEIPQVVDDDGIDRERLDMLLRTMPEEYREPLVLFYFNEFRYREIADILDCPIGTVMSRISRGRTYLKERLTPTPVESISK